MNSGSDEHHPSASSWYQVMRGGYGEEIKTSELLRGAGDPGRERGLGGGQESSLSSSYNVLQAELTTL